MLLSSIRVSSQRLPARNVIAVVQKRNAVNYGSAAVGSTSTDVTSSLLDAFGSIGSIGGGIGGICMVSALTFVGMRYHVANPNEYLVRTGLFLKNDIDISKKALQLPFQTLTKVNLEPTTFKCIVDEAMSQERISFNMPTVFTVGPKDDIESIKKYVTLLNSCQVDDLRTKVVGIIQGEARVAAGKIALDDLFNNRETFKQTLVKEVDSELKQFGLTVYNANIEELKDMTGNEYFSFMRKRALEIAVNNAKVAVAEQGKRGVTGEKQHITETRIMVANFEKDAVVAENNNSKEMAESNSLVSIAKADMQRRVAMAENESTASAEKHRLELQQEVEQCRNKQEIERLRATEFAAASVNAEIKVRHAEGIANSTKIEAEANAYALKIKAEATAYSKKILADADSYAIAKVCQAEADGLGLLANSAGSVENLNGYLMIKNNQLTAIAEQQSLAVQGMKPNVTIWNSAPTNNDSIMSSLMCDFMKSGVPLIDGLKQTTGVDLLKGFRNSTPQPSTIPSTISPTIPSTIPPQTTSLSSPTSPKDKSEIVPQHKNK